jgi:hypothetical protein
MSEHDVLKDIRSMMERSSTFKSISGDSGIWIGIYALLIAGYRIYKQGWAVESGEGWEWAVLLLVMSTLTGILLARNKAKRMGQPAWSITARKFLQALVLPLISGGILAGYCMNEGLYTLLVPVFLFFYGLGLFSAGTYTFKEIKVIGVLEVALGALALWMPEYGLAFFALGFGVLHILYGLIIKSKYAG